MNWLVINIDEVIWFVSGLLFAEIVYWMIRFWRRSEHDSRRTKAAKVLKRYGLTPQLYLATIGEENLELREAMDVFAFSGHIITNTKGEVVGKLCPRAEKGPHLRLVVSNVNPNG